MSITPAAVVMYSYNLPGRINEKISEEAKDMPVHNKDLIGVPLRFFRAREDGASLSSAKEIMIFVTEKSAPTIVEKAALIIIRLKIEPM